MNTCEVIDIEGNNGLGGIDIDNILTFDIISRYSIDKIDAPILRFSSKIFGKLAYKNPLILFICVLS